MAVCNATRRCVWPTLILLWMWTWEAGCDVQYQAEEVETRLVWNADPEWSEIQLRVGSASPVPVLQACGRSITRTILSQWMERKDAHRLLMDVSFAQEEEPSGQLGPLQVHLFDSNTPIARVQDARVVLDLQTSKPFPDTVPLNQISSYLNRSRALSLGSVIRSGFQLALSYSGKCVMVTSVRLYYRRCPDTVAHLALFKGTGAESGPLTGSCVKGAVQVSPPVRECDVDGAWGPLQGGCTCEVGHQVMDDTCQGKVPPVVITVTPDVNVSEHQIVPAPQQSRFSVWLTVGVLFGVLLLLAVIPIVVYVLPSNYTKLRSDQDIELLPINAEFSYRRAQEVEAAPQTSNSVEDVVQLLEGLSGRLLASLKEVLVERNKLTLGKELGKGEFGSVYEGVFTPDEGVDIKVAVKTMRVGIHSQEDLHEFLKEAEIMKNFDHENVVRLLGVTLQREQDSPLPVPLVILPYMKHGDLRRFLIATRYGDIPMSVPHQSLLRFMIDIAAGMDYLSTQGFLHRDLAARNCMLGDDLRVCVADFGLSKKIYSSNYYRQKVATRLPIKWMAMESLSESVYTTKSDVWSFGVTVWEIVSRGRTPYPGVHNHELLELLMSGHRLKPPEDCDHRLYEVMQSCWDKEPSRRPGFGELGEMLKGLLSELPALEASQEACYMNHGLEVAAAAAASSQEPQTDSERRWENVYQLSPVGAAAARDDNVEVEDGYLKYIAAAVADKGDDGH
ncbi:tyrosine-protein kinase receptor UFO isoform X2 [Cebidichthys violaceus]|uniref:tyrosine-protein kinase receptor UFO isoform X2 n=1 Tax=Cebidichthys violaceus TaxID=271503 RepID=UPI0035C9A64A